MNLVDKLHGQQVALNIHRAGSSAFPAADAASRQVHGPEDMPFHIAMRIRLHRYPLRLVTFNSTPGAIAHWA